MKALDVLAMQMYADGADKAGNRDLYAKPFIRSLPTNFTLAKKSAIKDYEASAKDVLQPVTSKPISLKVSSEEFLDIKRPTLKIAEWGQECLWKAPHQQFPR